MFSFCTWDLNIEVSLETSYCKILSHFIVGLGNYDQFNGKEVLIF